MVVVALPLASCANCFGVDHHDAGSPRSRSSRGPIAPRDLASPAAFDLVATEDGALLVWAPPRGRGGGVRIATLDAQGSARANDALVAPVEDAEVLEVAAAEAGARLGIAWIEAVGSADVRVRATYGGKSGETFAPPVDLAPSVSVAGEARGRLAIAASDDGTLALGYRTTPAACRASAGTCARYVHTRLGDTAHAAPRGIETMEVLVPCDPLLPGAAWTSGTWYSGVCSAESGITAHVFSLRQEISYAAVIDGPVGCAPVGLVSTADGVAARMHCSDGRESIVRVGLDGRASPALLGVHFEASCDEPHRPTLLATSGAETVGLTLSTPRSRLEVLLPPTIAPPGARAAWTGEVLIVAVPTPHDVFVHRWSCVDGAMTRTDQQ